MSLSTLGAAALATLAYASLWERRWVQVTRTDVPLPDLPDSLVGLTIAHLSDIHHGRMVPLKRIRRAVELTNALGADVIVVTGDFIDDHIPEIEPVARVLSGLRARLGVWGVLGGHDVRTSERLSRRALTEAGIRLLRNEAAPLVEGTPPLWIVGVRDNSEYPLDRLGTALTDVPQGARKLLLAHSPDIAYHADALGIDLVLSGHTHGGQVCVPFFGPLITESHYWRRFARGLTRAGDTRVYTNRGFGAVRLPFRFLCRPEIALLRLVRAPAEARMRREAAGAAGTRATR